MGRINSARISDMFSGYGADVYATACKTIKNNRIDNLLEHGVLVGLSGGADSVMLLCFLLEYRERNSLSFPIVASHVNHSIRGEEADRDERFCKQLCEDLAVEFVSVKLDVPAIAREMKLSVEEAARNVRYSIFQDIISGREDLDAIAVAHNMTDNAETVLLNILRGSGTRGARGIRPVRNNIVRPLIDISKERITLALEDSGISYVTDSSNLSSDYSRNYVRHEVLPTLHGISPEPEKMLARFANNLASDDEFICSVSEDFLKDNPTVTNIALRNLHRSVFVRVLTIMADYRDGLLPQALTSDVYCLLDKDNFSYSLPGGLLFVCERGVCTVRKPIGTTKYRVDIEIGLNHIDVINSDFIISTTKLNNNYLNVYKKSIQANLSSAIIEGSLVLRSKADGDTVYYGGMTHKVKKLFNDRKIPLSIRKTYPVLCDDRGVIWVPGFGVRDDGVPVDQRRDLFAVLATKE